MGFDLANVLMGSKSMIKSVTTLILALLVMKAPCSPEDNTRPETIDHGKGFTLQVLKSKYSGDLCVIMAPISSPFYGLGFLLQSHNHFKPTGILTDVLILYSECAQLCVVAL
jgi:hypothetical protein